MERNIIHVMNSIRDSKYFKFKAQIHILTYKESLKRAQARQYLEGEGGATFGITKFSDLTPEEFRSQVLQLCHLNNDQFLQMNFPSEIDSQPVMSQSPVIVQCDPNPTNYVIPLYPSYWTIRIGMIAE